MSSSEFPPPRSDKGTGRTIRTTRADPSRPMAETPAPPMSFLQCHYAPIASGPGMVGLNDGAGLQDQKRCPPLHGAGILSVLLRCSETTSPSVEGPVIPVTIVRGDIVVARPAIEGLPVVPDGILARTTQERAMTTEESLSGMVAKEVWSGVFRVVNDGVRNLMPVDAQDIVAGYDGSIWLRRSEDGLVRLGSDGSHPWPLGSPEDHVFEVAPDRTMWAITGSLSSREGAGFRSTDGEVWTSQPCPGTCRGVTVAPDGTVWASWQEEDGRWRTGHLGPTGWQPLDGDELGPGRFLFTDAGDIYGGFCDYLCYLLRYEDGVWQDDEFYAEALIDVGPDGTVWADAGSCWGQGPTTPCDQDGLARFAGGERAEWTSADLFARRRVHRFTGDQSWPLWLRRADK